MISESSLANTDHPLARRLLARGGHRLLEHWISGGTCLVGRRRECFQQMADALDQAYYDPTCPTHIREAIKALCMGEGSAIAWAKKYLSRGFPDENTQRLPMFERIDQTLADGRVMTMHQVGCCSGREIACFAERFPKLKFVGSDCDGELVTFLRAHWNRLPNLRFLQLRMDQLPPSGTSGLESDLVIASGGLHYMDPPALREFLRAANRSAARLFLSQPMTASFDGNADGESTPRGRLSWNHRYRSLLQTTGWEEIETVDTHFEELPGLKNFTAFAFQKKTRRK